MQCLTCSAAPVPATGPAVTLQMERLELAGSELQATPIESLPQPNAAGSRLLNLSLPVGVSLLRHSVQYGALKTSGMVSVTDIAINVLADTGR